MDIKSYPVKLLSVLIALCGVAVVLLLSSWLSAVPAVSSSTSASTSTAAQKSDKMPTTAMQAPEGKEIATFAAGCFWSMEAIFEQLKGVASVEPGFAGGHVATPSYEQTLKGDTGHAEAVHIIYDPKVVSYGDLLKVLLTIRNPTTLNGQGPDVGPNYRSVIFYHNAAQQKAAQQAIRDITDAKVWDAPIVTPVTQFTNFYQAEDYHRDYYSRHPDYGYCTNVIAPKLADLKQKFPDKVKS